MFIALDQLVYVWLCGWAYVWLGRGSCPNPDETISSCVGRHAVAQKKWALIAEKVINALFWFQPDHCRNAIEWDELGGSLDPIVLTDAP
jgi:hypothetical protein